MGFRLPPYIASTSRKWKSQRYIIYTFFFPLSATPFFFFFTSRGFFFLYTLHVQHTTQKKKKIKINRFALPVAAKAIIRSETLYTLTALVHIICFNKNLKKKKNCKCTSKKMYDCTILHIETYYTAILHPYRAITITRVHPTRDSFVSVSPSQNRVQFTVKNN